MSAPLDWASDGADWPHRIASRFVKAGGIDWHVQEMGAGKTILLLHGTGASTHSWRDIAPLLAKTHRVIALDLPGHAFTDSHRVRNRSLDAMGSAIALLLEEMDVEPDLLVGHSAGAAIALQLVLAGHVDAPVVGFGPALSPFAGPAEFLFPALAKLLFVNPLVPRIFSGMTRFPGEADRFIRRATGSEIDAAGRRLYARLLGNSAHCKGALAMMADWDLAGLNRRLGEIGVPVLLVHGDRDRAVPMSAVRDACKALPDCRLEILTGLGHIAHEERPDLAAELIESALQ
ncbi:alpha/beta fold hydrolase BchO [Sphingomicrobium sediminis]|uniref:Alpha/beta fold hydrolase n=1 Tax=Sphingomicrobium sediminis TaxID=2950949 RepID=A0A9X2EJQ1_9SPHN|nr:alpha/beta fold hydrolase BchO [Sphingomicrobium sediminis]MCM8556532.1 alpha/beta fold hydrolase [Sphingomicrobium sediminis]